MRGQRLRSSAFLGLAAAALLDLPRSAAGLGGRYYSHHSGSDEVCVVDTYDIILPEGPEGNLVQLRRGAMMAEKYIRTGDTLDGDEGVKGTVQPGGVIVWSHGYISRPGSPFSAEHHPDQCCKGKGCKEMSLECCGVEGDENWGCFGLYTVKRVGECDSMGMGGRRCTKYECHESAISVPVLIALIVGPLVLYYVGSMTFFWWLTNKAGKAAAAVPKCGYVAGPPHSVDIPSDFCAVESPFYGMGRADMMPDALAQVMTPQEFGELFSRINETNRATIGFRCWHLLFWPAMIIFWPIGGFMFMIWGIQRHQSLAVNCVGTHLQPFCERKGINYVLILGVTSQHSSSPTIVRFFLPRGPAWSGGAQTIGAENA